jgi:excinuclease UvrABC ATPase subunit
MNYYICPRCNGNGIIEKYMHVDNGICFECSGSGKVTQEEKERIEKDITREAKRNNTRITNNQDRLESQLKKQWFNDADTIYIINISNTYSIKDQLKQDKAIFNNSHKVWYFTEQNEKYNTIRMDWQEIIDGKEYAITLQKLIQERSGGMLKGY